jgi:hypothetical protein
MVRKSQNPQIATSSVFLSSTKGCFLEFPLGLKRNSRSIYCTFICYNKELQDIFWTRIRRNCTFQEGIVHFLILSSVNTFNRIDKIGPL